MSRLRGPFFPQKKVNTGLEIGNEFCNSVRKQCNQKRNKSSNDSRM